MPKGAARIAPSRWRGRGAAVPHRGRRRHDNLWALVARAATAEGETDPRMPRRPGLACAAIGRDLEARAWLRLAVRRDPLDAESQKALYLLERPPEGVGMSSTGTPPGTGPRYPRPSRPLGHADPGMPPGVVSVVK